MGVKRVKTDESEKLDKVLQEIVSHCAEEQREQFQAERRQDFWSFPEVIHCPEERYQVSYRHVSNRIKIK